MASQESALPSGPLPRQEGRTLMPEEKTSVVVATGIERFASERDRGDRKPFAATVWNRDLHNRLMQRDW